MIAFCLFFLLFYIKLGCYVKKLRFKYLIFCSSMFFAFEVFSQSANNDAIVTIIGNDNNDNNVGNQFSNYTIQNNNPPPPEQQQFAPTNDNIEPTLENGFHMRFQIESPASVERMSSIGSSSGFSSGGSSSGGLKTKKHSVSIAERSFNFKKKLKNWLPKRKKKYHPTLCEKFR